MGRERLGRWEVGIVRDEKVGVGLRKEVEGRWGDKRGGEGMGRGCKVDI